MSYPVRLVLKNKLTFAGQSFGWPGSAGGEAVFNTGMIGYVESLTDPSYAGQILVLTYPLIGNYGVPIPVRKHYAISELFESKKIQIAGLVVSDYSHHFSHWAASQSLAKWLFTYRVPAITGVDTRRLTQVLRQHGTMSATLFGGSRAVLPALDSTEKMVDAVSTKKIVVHRGGKKTVALIDCGVKLSIIRNLLQRGLTVIQVPWNYNPMDLPQRLDGLVVSNGPGDPRQYRAAILHIKKILAKNLPTLGICLGNQLVALAAGGSTYKLKFGHRSQNQPCVDADSGRCYITAQNHGYAVRASSLARPWRQWFYNANDETVEGIHHLSKPFFAVQFHPESHPGPHDTNFIFDQFVKKI